MSAENHKLHAVIVHHCPVGQNMVELQVWIFLTHEHEHGINPLCLPRGCSSRLADGFHQNSYLPFILESDLFPLVQTSCCDTSCDQPYRGDWNSYSSQYNRNTRRQPLAKMRRQRASTGCLQQPFSSNWCRESIFGETRINGVRLICFDPISSGAHRDSLQKVLQTPVNCVYSSSNPICSRWNCNRWNPPKPESGNVRPVV